MNCESCANYIGQYYCLSMLKIPKNRWCKQSKESAIQAEKDIIAYSEKQKERFKHLPFQSRKVIDDEMNRSIKIANARILELEVQNV